MQFNTKIPIHLKQAFQNELAQYKHFLQHKQYGNAWHHLERSHIIGQSYPLEHTYSHWLMLKFGFRQKNIKEVLGQVLRLLVGGWKSFINRVPLGNTGGADVPPLKSMPIPEDIGVLFKVNH